jgi:TonB family protein
MKYPLASMVLCGILLMIGCRLAPETGLRAGKPIPSNKMFPMDVVPGDWDVPPVFLSGDAPSYPVTRLLNGEAGSATISYVIDEDGRTKDFYIVSATFKYFGSHAAYAVKRWRFAPARKDGKPVAVKIVQTFNYEVH